ncbi:tumor necrosis factor receptor superfamily member 18 [Meleagris gallopavo]|uniref:TNF receptor superfamily member 18 n=1 Tax=Meleagris gallopavo TaxID=9103 RepID=G1MW40_MELGA|nr:tumor necrosis factor receptor superfamily member 18 [Meleagris gallopavo]
MTVRRREVCLLNTRACLLLAMYLWHWAHQTLASTCPDGELRAIAKDVKKCCPKCFSSTENISPCEEAKDADCKCPQGFSCADRSCTSCRKTECPEGEELIRLGVFYYTYSCKPCETGTYSNGKNSWCQSWTDCESSGLLTIKQGNSTHNSLCGYLVKYLDRDSVTNDSRYTIMLAILTAVGLFVLILLTFFLHLCIWLLKKEKHPAADNVECNFSRLPLAPQPPHHKEETYSCQFPEEEHGDKILEEKPYYFQPPSLH